ncbi:class I SAM-dependent methyltransferase [Nodularia sphaerocarpa]|uniref:class I SAM-dependent methyltransferase n=1 Tax=Nodularia sphaerocarpa TaxID=137816 RepID=UPI001EFBE500|nr:class I SAM-dependent methyltransferase [Nodularia sphaerocarpa]MDB9372830.1 class I SAM-dependent methyltransferase [Nodularia sphaerocarpa CS-585]MDB9377007.1 class I SAM-dependent methyltransferase [Nodularia sphaerocarpa CS-585A2]ULP71576.1 putative S-adenosylmethionine-dependent methyltransferase/MSMEI_2290 [Nodularia sphaerocarpa UHCC 0038]
MPDKINTNLNFGEDSIDPFDQSDENLWVKIEHLGRYLFAADYLRQFKLTCVADIACGVGYGIRELEKIADLVIGVDGNSDLLKQAAKQCNNSQTKFVQHNLEQPALLADKTYAKIDAIVSFETLEHLINPTSLLEQFSELLSPGGLLICSVPNVLYEPRDNAGLPTNSCHKQFFNYQSLSRLLADNGLRVNYRVGQGWSNILFKRETQLLRNRSIPQRLGEYSSLSFPEIIRHLSYLIAYPTVEDVDASYSLIIVGQKIK